MILAFLVGWWLGGVGRQTTQPAAPPTPTATLTLTSTPRLSPTATPTQTATPTETPTPRPTIDPSTLIYDIYMPLVFRAAP